MRHGLVILQDLQSGSFEFIASIGDGCWLQLHAVRTQRLQSPTVEIVALGNCSMHQLQHALPSTCMRASVHA